MTQSKLSTECEIKIPFHDVDSARIAWHGHYAKYLEVARCELLDTIDYNYPQMLDSGYMWPVIDMHIRYAQPLKFGQLIRVQASISEWEHRLKINYLIFCTVTGKRLTKASTVQVAVDSKGEMLLVSPRILLEKLGVLGES